MCGIFCAICENDDVARCKLHRELDHLLQNRGPDVSDQLQVDNVLLAGNVLWQQGAAPQKQPLSLGDWALLFNGDLYNLEGKKPAEQSDTAWLMEQLQQCDDAEGDAKLLALMQQLRGPYCLVLYNRRNGAVYFCRDALGRNSLLMERQADCILMLSTSYYEPRALCLELPPLGLYRVQTQQPDKCMLYPWQQFNLETLDQLQRLDNSMRWRTKLQHVITPPWLLREEQQAADRYDFYALIPDVELQMEQLHKNLLEHAPVQRTLQRFGELLDHSVAQRVRHIAPICRKCKPGARCAHAKLCVLFSGGIDCSILALLADRYVPAGEPIELINVAFERVANSTLLNVNDKWEVPDRQTAHQTHLELQRLCPERNWQLLEVNVTREELRLRLEARISHLIYPLQTVLDECMGCAFWFAAAAPESTARVALLGSGADELFGGYTRHRNVYRHTGGDQEALRQEFEMDWQRIPARNLARDDRVIADTGKTARAPFIEELLVRLVRSLAPEQRCCYALPGGLGDKLLLRLHGYSLGLRGAVVFKKRAIQFGSRIADRKQQATDISEFLRFERLPLE
ncbi:hypothetical protein KR222_006569 [Zaprionus bogoriensis]|nr:hypothetical protein KR222_006569 [Zaprionus bogoriensis]